MAEGPMETERITLSQRERDRLKVLHEVQQKQLTQVEAAARLKVTDRQVRRMLLRIREHGDAGLVHGLRGRPSNRKLAARFEHKILERLRQRYADFGPTLAAEHLAKEGFLVSRETLRKWMTKAALWRPRSQRVKAIHVWRERRACFGELVMQDSSPFRWLEDRGPACHLIALIDDATSRVWGRFTEQDTTEENLRTLQGWLRRYGRPLAHYTDKNSIFQKAGPQPLLEQLRGDPLRTQFGRALHELGIEWIAAHSPQAKGRIERLFATLQDRLVKEMRLAGIDSIQGANHFLEMRFLPEWEQRFTVVPRQSRNAHRRLGREQHLEEILSVRVARRVAQDHTVSWDGNRWGVLREEVCAGFVELRWRSNGGWTEAIGCATEAAICTCGPAQNRCGRPQVLPAYGLQDLRNKHQDPNTKSNPNTMYLQTTLGEDHGSGHFYLAKTRTFLLCVDRGCSAGRKAQKKCLTYSYMGM